MKKRDIVFGLIVTLMLFLWNQYDSVDQLILIGSSENVVYNEDFSFDKNSEMTGFSESDYEMTIDYKYIPDKTVKIMLDDENEKMGFSNGNRFYLLDSVASKNILSLEIFSDIYEYNSPPGIQFEINGNQLDIQATDVSWNYKLLNGEIRTISFSEASTENYKVEEDSVMSFKFENEPQEIDIETSLGDQIQMVDSTFDILNIDEPVIYKMTALWENEDYYGQAEYTFKVQVDLPLRIQTDDHSAYPGDYIVINLMNANEDEEITIDQPFVNKVELWQMDKDKIAIIPIDYWTKTGDYEIRVSSNQLAEDLILPIEIQKREFATQYLYIDETIASETRNDAAYEEYNLYMIPARTNTQDKALFEGLFIQPVEGRISTEFGMYRYVNDSITSYRHSGLDIAIDRGTPIMATNSGVVNLAQQLILTGNTIVIDHGLGIFSTYFHMDSLNVENGQMVTKGDIIGTVGSTGFSTGPHLHWTMSYYRTNLDPYLFIKKPILELKKEVN